MKCQGSIIYETPCDNEATWAIHCTNPQCEVQNVLVCTEHEIETRAVVIQWSEEGGVCPFCNNVPYDDPVHATSAWRRLDDHVL